MSGKFEINKEYSTRSICDHDCVFSYKIISRTEKTVTIENKFGIIKKCRISIYEGIERIKPEGTYSMCPIISAQ